jgi:hypothetical protein
MSHLSAAAVAVVETVLGLFNHGSCCALPAFPVPSLCQPSASDLLQDLLAQLLVVVDLSVHCHDDGLVLVEQGLVTRGWVHDGQALMGQEVVG